MSASSFRFSFVDGLRCLAVVGTHVALGPMLSDVQGPARRWLSLLTGLMSALLLCGGSMWYLVAVSAAASLVLYLTRNLPGRYMINFTLSFACLSYYRWCYTCVQTHGILMQMVLRMISLAADLSTDDKCVCSTSASQQQQQQQQQQRSLCLTCSLPKSPLDIVCYLWCHVGLLTTPVIRYRTFQHHFSDHFSVPRRDRMPLVTSILKILAILVPTGIIFDQLIRLDMPTKDEFFERGLVFKLCYLAAMCLLFRCRLYAGLLLGEASALSLGLGVYPGAIQCRPEIGPVSYADKASAGPDTSTVYGVRPSVEAKASVQEYARCWNATVQGWLVRCVYKRAPGSRIHRMLVTFFVSGLWHGNHLGHWLFFIQVFVYIVSVEMKYERHLHRLPYFIRWLLFNVTLGYWFTPYSLLDISLIWKTYSELWFIGQLATAIGFALS